MYTVMALLEDCLPKKNDKLMLLGEEYDLNCSGCLIPSLHTNDLTVTEVRVPIS